MEFYNILLVDDEPLVLSGIKFLIDWSELKCKIQFTARNGKQALEIIRNEKVDLVLCDINMPVMTGIELLKEVAEEPYAPVFIMLTNHQEFDLARESLRFRAIDYLLKTQLEPEHLRKAILLAIEECCKRKKVADLELVGNQKKEDKERILKNYLLRMLEGGIDERDQRIQDILLETDILNSYFIGEFILDYSAIPLVERFSKSDMSRIFECIHEILEAILPRVFPKHILVYPNQGRQKILLFIWGEREESLRENIELLFTKLTHASQNITPTRIHLLVTRMKEKEELAKTLKEVAELEETFYRTSKEIIFHEELQSLDYQELCVKAEYNKLIVAVRAKDISVCREVFEQIANKLESVVHSRQNGIRVCRELYSTTCSILNPLLNAETSGNYFMDVSKTISELAEMTSLSQLLLWIDDFSQQVQQKLVELTGTQSDTVENVRRYIWKHVREKIALQDIADYVNINPCYLSALFKKQSGQNLVDYINEAKMEVACDLLKEGKYKIYEISYMLSFENAYYFTKVFKRYIGVTPKEYR